MRSLGAMEATHSFAGERSPTLSPGMVRAAALRDAFALDTLRVGPATPSFPPWRGVGSRPTRPRPDLLPAAGTMAFKRQQTHTPFVDPLTQLFAGLEMGHVLARQAHRFTRFGVAPDSGRPVVERKAAKPPDFDTVAGSQGFRHLLD